MDRRTASSKKPQQAVGPCRSQTPSTGGTLSIYFSAQFRDSHDQS